MWTIHHLEQELQELAGEISMPYLYQINHYQRIWFEFMMLHSA
jgi:hypothetical protein